MATHEIVEKDWESYFQAFTERHRGALVTVEDVDPMTQPEVETEDMPFVSIAYRPAESGAAVIELVTEGGDGGGGGSNIMLESPCFRHSAVSLTSGKRRTADPSCTSSDGFTTKVAPSSIPSVISTELPKSRPRSTFWKCT